MINQVVRYEAVLGLIARTPGTTLADIGSGSAGLAPLVASRWERTAVDYDFTDYGAVTEPAHPKAASPSVVADARELPFPDRAFDVVIALDLLEHVGAPDREVVCRELARVSDGRLILACPTGSRAEESDARLLRRLRRRGLGAGTWLEEHVANGLPEEAELVRWVGSYGRITIAGNENLHSHSLLIRAEARRPGRVISRAVGRLLLPRIAENASGRRAASLLVRLLRGWDLKPTYRTIVVVDRPPARPAGPGGDSGA